MLSGLGAGNVLCGHFNDVLFDVGEGRLRREPQMEQIRMKRHEIFYRFWISKGLESSPTFPHTSANSVPMQSMEFVEIWSDIWSEDVILQLHAITLIEKFLSADQECPTALVQRIIQFLTYNDISFLTNNYISELQYAAAWVLINIKSKSESVLEALGILLDSPYDHVCEMAVFGLGTFACDSFDDRDLVLSNEVLEPLLKLLQKHTDLGNHAKLSMLRNLTWTLSIFCHKLPRRFNNQVIPAFTTLERLLHSDDEEVLINTCWAIFGLAEDVYDRIDPLMDAGLCPKLVDLLLHRSRWVQIPVLMTVALIPLVKTHIQALIDHGTLGRLLTLLTEGPNTNDPQDGYLLIKRDVCSVISGILCGTKFQIQAVINAKLFDHLVEFLESPEVELQEEAFRAIGIASNWASREQIEYLFCGSDIINRIINLIPTTSLTAKIGLSVVENLMKAGSLKREENLCSSDVSLASPFMELLMKAQCVEKLKMICRSDHFTDATVRRAINILKVYFNVEYSRYHLGLM